MKTAILFAGHLRTFEKCYENHLHHIIRKNDADVFFYTSKQNSHKIVNSNRKKSDRRNMKANAIRNLHIYENDDKKIENLHKLYKPYLREIYYEEEEYDYSNKYRPPSKMKDYKKQDWDYFRKTQFKKVYYGFEKIEEYAKQNNIRYDYFVRMRPDMVFSRRRKRTKGYSINLEKIMTSRDPAEKTIYTFGGWTTQPHLMTDEQALFDGFACGSFENMRRYCSLYERTAKYAAYPFTPENQLALHMKENELCNVYLNRKWKRYYKTPIGRGYRIERG